jgi:iron complex outermembrane receptor protein
MKRMYAKAGLRHLVAAFLMLACTALMAQTKVSGTVTDRTSGEALIGVNIVVKGQSTGTITDIDGRYELNVGTNPPITLVFSYTGYTPQEVALNSASAGSINVRMDAEAILMNEVVVSASRVEERILESPVTIEKMDAIAIRQTAAPDFYDGISNLKGVQTTQGRSRSPQSTPAAFGAVANERFVQLIDGMDNAAPLLNFPTGNIVGISELDVQSVELVPGAASALYGPNAFNGILIMNSKNPYAYQGLSVQVKTGITTSDAGGSNPYNLLSARYAKAFGKFAFKLNASYLTATDWTANDYETSAAKQPTTAILPGFGATNFDGLNTYGDETEIVVPMAAVAGSLSAGFGAAVCSSTWHYSTEQAQALLGQTIPRLPTLWTCAVPVSLKAIFWKATKPKASNWTAPCTIKSPTIWRLRTATATAQALPYIRVASAMYCAISLSSFTSSS